eukprot:354411-Prorocentrum_minimum.AAC.2
MFVVSRNVLPVLALYASVVGSFGDLEVGWCAPALARARVACARFLARVCAGMEHATGVLYGPSGDGEVAHLTAESDGSLARCWGTLTRGRVSERGLRVPAASCAPSPSLRIRDRKSARDVTESEFV